MCCSESGYVALVLHLRLLMPALQALAIPALGLTVSIKNIGNFLTQQDKVGRIYSIEKRNG